MSSGRARLSSARPPACEPTVSMRPAPVSHERRCPRRPSTPSGARPRALSWSTPHSWIRAAAPLVSALGKVVVVTSSGAVWAWTPGAAEPTRVGSFGSPIDGGAALADDHTLVAVAAGEARLTALDLSRGVAATRATSPNGLWLGPPAMRGGIAYVRLLPPSGGLALAIHASGRRLARTLLATRPPLAPVDGGAPPLLPGLHTPPLIDAAGTLAVGPLEGGVGIVARTGTVEILTDACAPSSLAPASAVRTAAPEIAGLAPLAPPALLVACRSRAILA